MVDAGRASGAARRRDERIDRVMAAAYAVLLCLVQVAVEQPLGIPVVLLLTGALAVRRSNDVLMVVLATTAGLVQVLSLQVTCGPDLAFAVVCSTLGSPDERWRRRGLVAALAAVVGAALVGLLFGLANDTVATAAGTALVLERCLP